MKNKSINQVSIINGEDGPTSVFIFGEAQKQSLKIRIRNAIYQSRRKRIEKRIAANPHTLAEVVQYAKDHYDLVEINPAATNWIERQKNLKASLIMQHKPELLGQKMCIRDRSMDSLGTGTYGMNNIVIAPNVLETMANDPKKAAYYEKMIQDFFASQSTVKAQMAVGGFEIQSYGMVIHPDGTAHYYVCGDVSPEKKAKIEAQMKAEDEEKAKRRRQYLERSEEAAEKRRQIEEINMQKSKKDAAFDDNISAVNVLSEVDRAVAIAAYENIANTFNENIIKSTIDN